MTQILKLTVEENWWQALLLNQLVKYANLRVQKSLPVLLGLHLAVFGASLAQKLKELLLRLLSDQTRFSLARHGIERPYAGAVM